MTSPYVRRWRLAIELRKLREETGLTADELAKRIHYSRMKVSRLENAHGRPDVRDVIKILNTLNASGETWNKIVQLACDAGEKGWWDSYGDAMGARQRLYADIESGAATVREYNDTSIPGIFHTPEFITTLVELTKAEGPLDFKPDKVVEARLRRQDMIRHEDGPAYDVVLDEVVIRRITVPPDVMASQVEHMTQLLAGEPRLTVRILPVDAQLPNMLIPRAAFFLYTFPDPADLPMAVVDTLTTDLVYTERQEVKRYKGRYDLLREAALSPEDSLALLRDTADRLTQKAGSYG